MIVAERGKITQQPFSAVWETLAVEAQSTESMVLETADHLGGRTSL